MGNSKSVFVVFVQLMSVRKFTVLTEQLIWWTETHSYAKLNYFLRRVIPFPEFISNSLGAPRVDN